MTYTQYVDKCVYKFFDIIMVYCLMKYSLFFYLNVWRFLLIYGKICIFLGKGGSIIMTYNDSVYAAFATLGTILLWMVVIMLAVAVFTIVCQWRIFTKAGEPGWAALIPFYNVYILFKIAWNTQMFWIYLGVLLGSSFLGNIISGSIGTLITFAGSIAVLVLMIMLYVKLAKAFGYSGGFAVGLILLNTIFLAIMAFSSNTYVGPDGIMNEAAKQAALNTLNGQNNM